LSRYALSDTELVLLVESCRLVDECEQLKRALLSEGAIVPGSAGQPRTHPALGELRQHRIALSRLLAQLALPEPEGVLATPAQAKARRAANTRWSAYNAAKAERRGDG
jgi:hypothetical protein